MSVYPSRAAEKCLFKELFRDVQSVQRNGGTLTGAPVVRDGVTFDATAKYVIHDITGVLNGQRSLSFVCEFTPNFAADDSVSHVLFDSLSTGRYLLYKSSANTLILYLGGTVMTQSALGTFGPHWNAGEKNTLVVSSESGNTNMWLNGAIVLTADATAWTPTIETQLITGILNNLSSAPFDGVIHSLSIHSCLMDGDDAQAIYDGTLFDYPQRADLWLDMAESTTVIDKNDEQLTNGEFTSWTPNGAYADPDSWISINPATAANHIEESPTGYMHIVSDGTFVGVLQTGLTVGRRYSCSILVTAATGTGVVAGVANYLIFAAPGLYTFEFVADSVSVSVKRWTACDFTVDYIRIVPVLDATLDKSRNGRDFLLGDGIGGDTPAFLNPGFDTAGGKNFRNLNASGLFAGVEQSIVICMEPDFAADDGSYHYLLDATNGSRYTFVKLDAANLNRLSCTLGNTTMGHAHLVDYGPHWRVGGRNVLVIASRSGSTAMYLNGHLVASVAVAWSPADPAGVYLGTTYGLALEATGIYRHFSTYSMKLSSLQVRDLTLALGVNV